MTSEAHEKRPARDPSLGRPDHGLVASLQRPTRSGVLTPGFSRRLGRRGRPRIIPSILRPPTRQEKSSAPCEVDCRPPDPRVRERMRWAILGPGGHCHGFSAGLSKPQARAQGQKAGWFQPVTSKRKIVEGAGRLRRLRRAASQGSIAPNWDEDGRPPFDYLALHVHSRRLQSRLDLEILPVHRLIRSPPKRGTNLQGCQVK